MSLSTRSAAVTRAVLISRILGFCVYVAAFFLPACREPATLAGVTPDSYMGYNCAWMTLVNTFSGELWISQYSLAILSGWINPLILLYLFLLLFPKLFWLRRIVAGSIALFIAGTWVFFALVPLVPLIGHILWIAGILLILVGEAIGREDAGSAAA
jgi:hypothetical protein